MHRTGAICCRPPLARPCRAALLGGQRPGAAGGSGPANEEDGWSHQRHCRWVGGCMLAGFSVGASQQAGPVSASGGCGWALVGIPGYLGMEATSAFGAHPVAASVQKRALPSACLQESGGPLWRTVQRQPAAACLACKRPRRETTQTVALWPRLYNPATRGPIMPYQKNTNSPPARPLARPQDRCARWRCTLAGR